MGASSCSSSVRLLLPLLCLLGFCFAASHQKSDSCDGDLPVARLVPFDSDAFHCITLWKDEDFILRVRLFSPHCCGFLVWIFQQSSRSCLI